MTSTYSFFFIKRGIHLLDMTCYLFYAQVISESLLLRPDPDCLRLLPIFNYFL